VLNLDIIWVKVLHKRMECIENKGDWHYTIKLLVRLECEKRDNYGKLFIYSWLYRR
jgi:hypothetical protein